MFSKFSVKKPYTVIVGVVMCLLLGVISFMNSTTDLLPEMELPYVVIYSTYPGASAEKVETSLTRILESAVSTTENLSNIDIHGLRKHSVIQQLCIPRTIWTAKT